MAGRMTSATPIDQSALDAARRLVAIARARYPVVEAWLYGSHARGEARGDSDVDVAVVVRADAEQTGRARWTLAGEAFDIMLDTGRLVSPFTITDEHWRHPDGFSNPFLVSHIRRDGVAL